MIIRSVPFEPQDLNPSSEVQNIKPNISPTVFTVQLEYMIRLPAAEKPIAVPELRSRFDEHLNGKLTVRR